MKRLLCYLLAVGFLFCFRVPPVLAHYLYLQPQGHISGALGSQVTISAYLHIDSDDVIYGWGFSQVFDSVELTRISDSFAFGDNPVGSIGTIDYEHERDGFTYLARYDWSFEGFKVGANEDYLLFSVTYKFNGGALDGPDVWFDWNVGEDVFFEFETPPEGTGYVNSLPVEGSGPDYASKSKPDKAKPLPWLHLLLNEKAIPETTALQMIQEEN